MELVKNSGPNKFLFKGLQTSNNKGAKGAATITAKEYGDGLNHVTELTLKEFAVGSAVGAANLAFGAKIYELPAGAQAIEKVYVDIALKGTTNIVADTPDVGIGSVVGSGAVAVLGGTGTFEDYLTGQTSGAIDGTNDIEAMAALTSGIGLNKSTDEKSIFLNAADGWAGAGDVTASGKIVIVWKTLS